MNFSLLYRVPALLALCFVLSACDSSSSQDIDSDPDTNPNEPSLTRQACEFPQKEIVSGGPGKDGIPALSDPLTVSVDDIDYMEDDDRVIALMIGDRPVAVPHNILWWHEIANFNASQKRLAATYCPLTGSSIVFDRRNIGEAELGVSGLLYQNNLIMYDRNETEALWSQILTGASCESDKGVPLETVHHVEMNWAGWKALYPNAEVISSETGFSRNYTRYPYGDYEQITNGDLLFPMRPLDTSRPPKERALGIPDKDGSALVFPFGLLDETGPMRVVSASFNGRQIIVLWDGEKQAAAAYEPTTTGGNAVDMQVESGKFIDRITGDIYEVNGRVMTGDNAGISLNPVAEAYVAFWFAWPAFHPDTQIFSSN